MADSSNLIIDRRRLRRKLTFWRIAAFCAAAGIIVAAVMLSSNGLGDIRQQDHIARIAIEGPIFENKKLIGRIDEAAKSDAVKAIILTVDSQGGTTVGGEAIHEAVKAAAAKKPVVAEIGTLAASAGYMIASATNHIVSRETSLVGSIGVIVQGPNFARALDKLGIDVETIKSSPLKAEPSPFNETTEAERDAIRLIIEDSYAWFVDLIIENRHMTRDEALAVATGAIFTGRQGLKNGLVDALGGEKIVLEYLATREIDPELEIIEWKEPARPGAEWLSSALPFGAHNSQAETMRAVLQTLGLENLMLDGLVSVWQGLPADQSSTR